MKFERGELLDSVHLYFAYTGVGTSIGHGGEFDQPPANACRADFLLIRV
jgi:hypothetical protein